MNLNRENKIIAGVIIGVAALLLFIFINPFVLVKAGERGVVLKWGAVTDRVLDEGIHWLWPVVYDFERMDVTIQKEERKTQASSKDMQVVTTLVTINYHLDPPSVNRIYQTMRQEYSTRKVQPAIEEFVKKTMAQFTAEELITQREQVKQGIRLALADSLKLNGIMVDDIFMTDFQFSKKFDAAIEAKVEAEQRALTAKRDLERVKFEAKQKIEQARAKAEAIRIQARAITQQGGREYVNLRAIDKWDGKLPTQMIPAASVPFLDLTRR